MNWMGGSKARHAGKQGRNSEQSRKQKSFFEKVRKRNVGVVGAGNIGQLRHASFPPAAFRETSVSAQLGGSSTLISGAKNMKRVERKEESVINAPTEEDEIRVLLNRRQGRGSLIPALQANALSENASRNEDECPQAHAKRPLAHDSLDSFKESKRRLLEKGSWVQTGISRPQPLRPTAKTPRVDYVSPAGPPRPPVGDIPASGNLPRQFNHMAPAAPSALSDTATQSLLLEIGSKVNYQPRKKRTYDDVRRDEIEEPILHPQNEAIDFSKNRFPALETQRIEAGSYRAALSESEAGYRDAAEEVRSIFGGRTEDQVSGTHHRRTQRASLVSENSSECLLAEIDEVGCDTAVSTDKDYGVGERYNDNENAPDLQHHNAKSDIGSSCIANAGSKIEAVHDLSPSSLQSRQRLESNAAKRAGALYKDLNKSVENDIKICFPSRGQSNFRRAQSRLTPAFEEYGMDDSVSDSNVAVAEHFREPTYFSTRAMLGAPTIASDPVIQSAESRKLIEQYKVGSYLSIEEYEDLQMRGLAEQLKVTMDFDSDAGFTPPPMIKSAKYRVIGKVNEPPNERDGMSSQKMFDDSGQIRDGTGERNTRTKGERQREPFPRETRTKAEHEEKWFAFTHPGALGFGAARDAEI